jgi:endonuclease III
LLTSFLKNLFKGGSSRSDASEQQSILEEENSGAAVAATERNLAAVRDRLLKFADTVPPESLMPTVEAGATRLVAEDPFAFTLAVALDRGTKAEIIWTIPFWLREKLGHLDPNLLAQMTEDQILDALSTVPKKPRYMNAAPRTILEVACLVSDQFGGNAELIWKDKTADQVKSEFRSIYGVGDGIASMAVILLERCRNVRFSDHSIMDVKPDVHVQRVLYRLGVAHQVGENDALRAAVELNPEYPGRLDPALWVIGRQWCRKFEPDCDQCSMNDLCQKVEVQ